MPKRRRPRRGKSEHDNGGNEHGKPNDVLMTKPAALSKNHVEQGFEIRLVRG